MTAVFISVSISIGVGLFSMGGIFLLFLQRRIKILRLIILFTSSLILLSLGFWFKSTEVLWPGETYGGWERLSQVLGMVFGNAGLVLNIAVVPWLAAALCFRVIILLVKKLLITWNASVIVCTLLIPWVGDSGYLLTVVNLQLVLTIFGSILFLWGNLNRVPHPALQRGIRFFLYTSLVFLVLLVADILVSRLGVAALAGVDNLSLPLYMLVLHGGLFILSARHLNSEALIEGGLITESCRIRFTLTDREIQIIENLVVGKSNSQIADALFISKKTVENHLYNIYQKMGIHNRIQLLSTLQSWGATSSKRPIGEYP